VHERGASAIVRAEQLAPLAVAAAAAAAAYFWRTVLWISSCVAAAEVVEAGLGPAAHRTLRRADRRRSSLGRLAAGRVGGGNATLGF